MERCRCKTSARKKTTRTRSRSTKDSSSNSFWRIFTGQSGNFLVAFVFVVVVFVSYLLSTVAYKHDQELNCMKKLLEIIKGEVSQAEKSCMKTCKAVHTLQQRSMQTISTDILTVHNIGHAYDALREDIQGLLGNKELRTPAHAELKAADIRPTYDSDLLHKSKHTKRLPQKQDVETSFDKCTKDFMQTFKRSTNNFIQYWKGPVEDVTTLTESLVKCINVGVDQKDDEIKDFCKCVVKCISHKDDNYKLVNLHHPTEVESSLDAHSTQTVATVGNETNSKHPANDLNFES